MCVHAFVRACVHVHGRYGYGESVPALESGLVWVEGWDVTHALPYYVHVGSGGSQWEWPTDPHAHVVQHGSEDYAWYWKWLEQGQRGGEEGDGGEGPLAVKHSERNLFGACFG